VRWFATGAIFLAIKRIDHIAIVVPNAEEAATFYQDALGLKITHIEEVGTQESLVAFMPAGESEIELVEPTTETSGVAKFLQRHGAGMHHICLEVDDLETMLANLKEKGVQLINEEPTIGSGGKRIAFIHPKSTYGVLIELYETTPDEHRIRADILEDIRQRFDVERVALTRGVSAFISTLRENVSFETANRMFGSSRGITIKSDQQEEDIKSIN
jgi:methylmalonyl-CoA/ethylmalonyl-CoA epimerase